MQAIIFLNIAEPDYFYTRIRRMSIALLMTFAMVNQDGHDVKMYLDERRNH
jgi:hypothetical protein